MSRAILKSGFRLSACRAFSEGTSKPPKKAAAVPTPQCGDAKSEKVDIAVAGLSANIVKPKSQPLGPGASSTGPYKVPEYYCYDRFSYHEAEVEMAKYRCPQPSAQN